MSLQFFDNPDGTTGERFIDDRTPQDILNALFLGIRIETEADYILATEGLPDGAAFDKVPIP